MRASPVAFGLSLILAAAIGDRVVTERTEPPAGTIPSAPTGGVLSCPLATTGSGEAFLYLANVGDETGRARIFVRTASKEVAVERIGLPPDAVETIALHDLVKEPSGVVIEWSGGRVIAAHALHAARRLIVPGRELPRFMSVAQCAEPQGPELAIVGARTTLLGDTTLALFNPGPAPAVVSIAVRISGEFVEPQRLQRRVVRPLSRRDFSLRAFAFGRDEIAVVIRMDAGRVVAEALVENRAGAELLSAVPPLTDAIAIAGASGEGARLSLAATERSLASGTGTSIDLPVELTAARYADGVVDDPDELPAELGRDAPAVIAVPALDGRRPVAYALQPTSGRIAAGTSWPLTGSSVFDLVASTATQPATTWFAIVPTFGAGWHADLLIAAAAGEEANASVRVVGARPRTEEVDLPPGTVIRVPISGGAGVHAIVVTSEIPVAAIVIGRSGAIGYGSTATSLRIATETAVVADPVVGIGNRQR
jgi:hypothetical protein